jgi:hypothetical protein
MVFVIFTKFQILQQNIKLKNKKLKNKRKRKDVYLLTENVSAGCIISTQKKSNSHIYKKIAVCLCAGCFI